MPLLSHTYSNPFDHGSSMHMYVPDNYHQTEERLRAIRTRLRRTKCVGPQEGQYMSP